MSANDPKPTSLQINGLITPCLVEPCTPHFVHALVLGSAEGHGCPQSNVEVAEIFESSYSLSVSSSRPLRFNASIKTLAAT